MAAQRAEDSGDAEVPAQPGSGNDTAAAATEALLLQPEGLGLLRFGFLPGLFQLPAGAQDREFFSLDNVTLSQLPQQLQLPAAAHTSAVAAAAAAAEGCYRSSSSSSVQPVDCLQRPQGFGLSLCGRSAGAPWPHS